MSEILVNLKMKIDDFNDKLKDAEGKLKTTGKKFTDTGKNLTKKVSAPIVGIGTAAVIAGTGFEKQMGVVSALSGATGDDLEKLKNGAIDMAKGTEFSGQQVGEAFEYMALAGWETNDMLEGSTAILDLATAGQLDLAKAPDIVTDTLSMFSYKTEDAGKVADIFAKSQSNANLSTEQLSEALVQGGASAAAAGLSLEETSAMLSIFADQGLKGGSAGTALSAMLRDLKNKSEEGAVAIGDASVAIYDAQGNFRSMADIMSDIEKATASMTDEQRDAAISAVLGDEAMRGYNLTAEAGVDKLNEYTDAIENAGGTAAEQAETIRDSSAWQVMLTTIQDTGVALAEHLLPHVEKLADKVTELAEAFGELDEETQELIIILGAVLAVAGPIIWFFGQLMTVIGGISTAITWIGKKWALFAQSKAFAIIASAFKTIGAFFAGLSATALIVIGIVVAIIALIVIFWDDFVALGQWALDWITQKWGEFTDFMAEMWDKAKETASNFWDWLKEAPGKTWSWIMGKWEEYQDFMSREWDKMKSKANDFWNWLKGVPTGVWNWIKVKASEFRDYIGRIWEQVKSRAQTVWNQIKNVPNATWSWIKRKAGEIRDSIGNAFKSARDRAVGWLESLKNSWLWKKIDGLIGKWDRLKSKASGWVSNAGDTIGGWFGRRQPITSTPENGGGTAVPSLAIGTNRVLRDGLAEIHAGEAIVPAKVVEGGFTGGNKGINVTVELDGRQIAKVVSPHMVNQIRLKTGVMY